MENNQDEIRGAIALAKAVRQTALANAKVALEEAFTEKYQAMFAQKLKEDAAEGASPAAPIAEAPMQAEETVSEQEIDELIKELESEVGGDDDADDVAAAGAAPAAPAAPADPMAGAVPPAAPAAGAPPTGAPAGGQMVMCPVGTVATADMPPADGGMPPMGAPAVPGVAPVPPVAPAPVGGEVPPAPVGAPAAPPSDFPAPEGEGDEEVNLDELLESLKAEVEGEKDEEETIDEQTKLASSGIGGGKAGGSANKKPTSAASSTSKVENAANDDEGYPTIDQPKVVAKEATQAGRPNKASHATKDNLSTPSMGAGNGSGGQSETGHPKTDQAKTTAKEATQASRPNQAKNATATNLSTPGGMLQENASLKKQLSEAYETITYVKGQLNEINLLNAKLLYTNKLFKEFNISKEQKMRVVEMFDLSKNVREVKLTYANIAESLNFSGTDMKRKAKSSAAAQSITEGLASQSVGSTKPSQQIISEGKANQMVTRFQQIAGIKPAKK